MLDTDLTHSYRKDTTKLDSLPITRALRSPCDRASVPPPSARAAISPLPGMIRKNALFYRTLNGAQVGDLFMGLIHTAELCGANSFDYLTELQRHARELATNPAEWMPWNYRETLKAAGV